ncbi:MAG: MarR family transcriptional regulator [Saprospiraceae bacterium]|nr:MarR family transcriptional regulator [Saprospiraceae bacterium]
MVKIEEAIQQARFSNESSKAGINLLYTASWLSTAMVRVLRPHGISWQQFNIMRILRGQKGKPASLKLISERMIDKMSNTSRLVDKLVDKELVQRETCPNDRRQVDIVMTPSGSALLERASASMDAFVSSTFGHLNEDELKALNLLLDKLRTID